MFILLDNSTIFWLPMFVLNDDSYLNWNYFPVAVLISILLTICIYFTINLLKIVWKVRKYHLNASIILMFLFGSWFELLIGYILVIPYKYGIINIEGFSEMRFSGFETSWPKNMPGLQVSAIIFPLLLGSILIWHYFGTLIGAIITFIIERTIATFFVKGYETKPRTWITVFICSLLHLSAIFLCFIYCIHLLTICISLTINIIGVLTVVPYIVILNLYNIHNKNKMRKYGTTYSHYSLTAKFQVEENVRSLGMATKMALLIATLDVGMILGLFLIISNQIPVHLYFLQFIELFILLSPILLVPLILCSQNEWKMEFMNRTPFLRGRIKPAFNYQEREGTTHQETSQLHFQQLQNLWI